MPTTDTKTWAVTVSHNVPIHVLASQFTAAGAEVQNVLAETRVIVATGTDEVAARLRGIDGVADVSEVPVADVGPPGAEIA